MPSPMRSTATLPGVKGNRGGVEGDIEAVADELRVLVTVAEADSVVLDVGSGVGVPVADGGTSELQRLLPQQLGDL